MGAATLTIFREGLAQGVPGDNHLAWEVEISDGAGIRDMVYVSAHSGKVIDRISGIHENLNRRAYDALACERELVIVPGATHLFEERGTLEQVAQLAARWFTSHLSAATPAARRGQ